MATIIQALRPMRMMSKSRWASPTGFYPYSNSTSRYWRSGRTYKWIAVWKP